MLANEIGILQTKNAEHTPFEGDSAAHSSTDRSSMGIRLEAYRLINALMRFCSESTMLLSLALSSVTAITALSERESTDHLQL
jgi:hypothetical protein